MQDLIAKLEAATEGSRELDAEIHYEAHARPHKIAKTICLTEEGEVGDWVRHYTTSLDAALTLVPEGDYWICGAGKVRKDEPLYGAQIMRAGVIIGEGENDVTAAIALCIASLKARSA